jgi:hypothetical protein
MSDEPTTAELAPGEEVCCQVDRHPVPAVASCCRPDPEAPVAGAPTAEEVIRRIVIEELSGRGVTRQRAGQVAARIAKELGKQFPV